MGFSLCYKDNAPKGAKNFHLFPRELREQDKSIITVS